MGKAEIVVAAHFDCPSAHVRTFARAFEESPEAAGNTRKKHVRRETKTFKFSTSVSDATCLAMLLNIMN